MSIYNGMNPESWVYPAEHFFEINDFAKSEKVKIAVVSFGQDEVDWFRWNNNRKKITSWEDLKQKMFDHFQPTGKGSLGARLIHIQQDGSYGDYLKKVLKYSAPLPDMAESILMDAFVTGLSLELRAEVVSRHPKNLDECMREAQLVNDHNTVLNLALNELEIQGTNTILLKVNLKTNLHEGECRSLA